MSPPEIFDWSSVDWNLTGRNPQHFLQSATITDADTVDIATKMPVNGMNICRFYEGTTSQITFAPIMKFGDTGLYGMGVTNDGRLLYIIMRRNSSSTQFFNVEIHCFGESIN